MDKEALTVFLKYAFPCIGNKSVARLVNKEEVEDIRSHLASGTELRVTAERVKELYPGAIIQIRAHAGNKEFGKITADDVRNYFWYHHDDAIDKDAGMGLKEDAEECRVRVGKVVSDTHPENTRVMIRTGEKEFVNHGFDNRFAKAKKGDIVVVHKGHVVEKVPKEVHDRIHKAKMGRLK